MTKIIGVAFEDDSLIPHFYDFLEKVYPKQLVFGIDFEGELYKQFPKFLRFHIDLIRAGRKEVIIPNCDYRVDGETGHERLVEKGRNTIEVKETVIFNCDINAFVYSDSLLLKLFDLKLYIGTECPSADIVLNPELSLKDIIQLNSTLLSKLEVSVSETI